jgi:uncharacterized protein YprB with RNaseH-like and TPR domain
MSELNLDGLRCIHRHNIKEHPKCFAKGLIKMDFKNEKEFIKVTGLPWFRYPGYKIGYFDIETSNLDADWGEVLTWCIKEKGGKIRSDVVTKKELFEGKGDKRIVESFISNIFDFDILVGYYSDRFDIPFMRAKALHYKLDFPGFGDIYTWDLYFTVKSKLKISRRSLDNVCDYLGIKGKTPISKDAWRKAKYGDEKSLKEVLEHNIGDVNITEQLHDVLDFSRKWLRKSI